MRYPTIRMTVEFDNDRGERERLQLGPYRFLAFGVHKTKDDTVHWQLGMPFGNAEIEFQYGKDIVRAVSSSPCQPGAGC